MRVTRCGLLVTCLVVLVCGAASASVPPMISYQGKLMQPSGSVVPDGTYSIRFAIYDAQEEGNTLWSEVNSAVQVKGGLFSVLLGSVVNLPANLFDTSDRWFGAKVGTDPEMTPRQRIASVGYAVKAGTADIATTVPDGSITMSKLAPGVAIPAGVILMWSGQTGQIPSGWALCDGANGTPDLRDKFVVGAGSDYLVGAAGGYDSITLSVAQMPSHSHGFSNAVIPVEATVNANTGTQWNVGSGGHITSTNAVGGGAPFDNRPPYYALCYIMKLAY